MSKYSKREPGRYEDLNYALVRQERAVQPVLVMKGWMSLEMLGEIQRNNTGLSDDVIVENIAKQLETPKNKWVWLHIRQEK